MAPINARKRARAEDADDGCQQALLEWVANRDAARTPPHRRKRRRYGSRRTLASA